MGPKRKAATKKKAAGGPAAKKNKKEESTAQQAIKALQAADKKSDKKAKFRKVDANCHVADFSEVVDDYDCMLNQTNIGHNNNKFYVIQVLLDDEGSYYCWNRWGRVGETGASALKGPFDDLQKAVSDFEKKFKDKTKNAWKDRESFSPVKGKYTLIEVEEVEDEEEVEVNKQYYMSKDMTNVKPCSLDEPTQNLLKLILSTDMFKSAMADFNIDLKKMPLGKLSKAQIAKGYECLEEIEDILNKTKKGNLTELSSRFYTLIPHDFGRQRPPVIGDLATVQSKYDMLAVLGDIEIAQELEKEKAKKQMNATEVIHPLDIDYSLLKCKLEHLSPGSKEFKLIEKYTNNTKDTYDNCKIIDVFKVDREGERERFATHNSLKNRKLLWHGTNVAVVAAILKTGLRIMPHSGGRVGRGIYFASEQGKSSGYVSSTDNNIGIMFLNEVALGKEHYITRDNCSLVKAPNGKDCVIAKGQTEPDPKQDTSLKMEGFDVVIPQGKPVKQSTYKSSHFSESEYLVYKESQARIRYLLKMKMC
ncbi:protein mono-ADP-ribosyltransferase PARP3-like [Tubulanus polymorphus]|uniref:protein mono-ADP-ribosyltransferase PARP3-like n=1 Tax=Tubulanus polymorphus TaxID=672921 RepID=UPI003DA49712